MNRGREPDSCRLDDRGCITCGDVAVPLTVVAVLTDGDALCVDDRGHQEQVAVDLVGDVHTGDRLLVHAAVAIARLEAPTAPTEEAVTR